ncbi:ImmA/IrrE family metallo-endopeptidase [Pseudoduganella violacea]|uniref:Zn-dependent peptidase ImmA (M78 family) n=1 Tax=Pseudoduganella violacea TaxID=1715466 RepID=A0A7W5FT09_9BURK|nr:ImmA/IrrE family metallo-endopeptidase [Pseudoduganella violacea]MBB3117713.1 Zn-dependent peptidase ImmA (M78 family) [Pseudoduganella violacea]
MERIHAINPERIVWCCADFGITVDKLAAENAIPVASLERVLSREDESGLTFKQLSKIAAYFGRGVLFFLEEGSIHFEQVHTPAFRTLANQKPELSAKLKLFIERVEQQRSVFLSLREEMESGDLPRFEHPALVADDIPTAARLARKWLELPPHNSFDSYRLAIEKKGILVFRSNGYSGKWQIASESPIQGFTLYEESCPVIVVRKMRSEARQSFTLMHELGHILLHRTSSIDDESDMLSHQGEERDANAFAGHLLVPDEFLCEISDHARPGNAASFDAWLHPQCKAWGVSAEVILRRLMDARRLSQSQYAAYRAWSKNLPAPDTDQAARTYRHREPKHIFGETFVRAVLDALGERRISLSKASSYLDGLKLNDLNELEKHYAGL